jgi:hypothetical protein
MSKRPSDREAESSSSSAPRKSYKPKVGKPSASAKPTGKCETPCLSDSDDELEAAAAKRLAAAASFPAPSLPMAGTTPAKSKTSDLAAMLAGGKAPAGVATSHARFGETPTAKTARYLRSMMDKMRPDFEHNCNQDIDAFYKRRRLPDWRDEQGKNSCTAMRNIDELLNSNANFIPYENLAVMQHHENKLSMLGGVPLAGEGQIYPLVDESNTPEKTFKHAYDHMEDYLQDVIRETDNFALRPAQRLVIGAFLQRKPFEMHTRVRRLNEEISSASQVGLPPNVRPSLTLVNLRTGNGKTIVGITMAMTQLCNPRLWGELRNSWREMVWARTGMNGVGLTKCPKLTDESLARVTIAFVPSPLMNQWEEHAKLVNESMCLEFGYGFTIWKGLQVLQRGGAGDDGQSSISKTLLEAHKRSSAENKPILWIVPAKTEAMQQTLRHMPNLTLTNILYDECSHSIERRDQAPQSQALFTIILQATVERLQKVTAVSGSRHPLRVALNHQTYDPANTHHAAVFKMLSIPDWMSYMVSKDMADVMPCGIKRVQLKIRVQSLSGRLLKSDLVITGIDELLKTVLNSVGGDYHMDDFARKDLIGQCQQILGTGQASSSAPVEGSIYDRLCKAESGIKDKMKALPPPIDWARDGSTITNEKRTEADKVESKRRAFNATARMFGKLAESVDPAQPAECPISMEPIPPQKARIFACCTALYNGDYEDMILSGRCPMCNQPLKNGIVNANQAISAIVGEASTSAAPTTAAPETTEVPMFVDDEDKLVEAFNGLAAEDKTFSGGMKATTEAIVVFLRYKPRGARILLAFACEGHEGNATRQTRATLAAALGTKMDSIESISGRSSKIVEAFVKLDDTNRVLLINTNDRSLSLEGLDLWTAQLIILDKMTGAFLQPATVVQAIGRIMRPQFELYLPDGCGIVGETSSALPGKKKKTSIGHPAKWLVLLEKNNTVPAAPINDDNDSSGDDLTDEEREDDQGEWEQLPDNEDNANVPIEDGEEEWEAIPEELVDVDPDQARALLGN